MKSHPMLLAAAFAAALTTTSNASTFAPAALAAPETFKKPVLVTVVEPKMLPPDLIDTRVGLRLTVDADGTPRDISFTQWLPAAVEEKLVTAVSKWRFTPAEKNGVAVPVRVVLPIRLVDRT